MEVLTKRCTGHGIEALVLTPRAKDLNIDLRAGDAASVKVNILSQLVLEDARCVGL